MKIQVKLEEISRGFGGDNAVYHRLSDNKRMLVAVGWALLSPYCTVISVDGEIESRFDDKEYIQPHVALVRLGYDVTGTVDFVSGIADFKKGYTYSDWFESKFGLGDSRESMIRDDTWMHKKRVVVSMELAGKLTDFWDDMMVIAHDDDTPQEIRGVLMETMGDFPMWVVEVRDE